MLAIVVMIVIGWASVADAAVRYISPTGSNSNNGQTTSTPWLTWSYAFSQTACGDTLVARDGTYTTATNGSLVFTKVCTLDTKYTIRAENERLATINGSGVTYSARFSGGAAYASFEGFIIQSNDIQSGGGASVIQVSLSSHIDFKRNICRANNRYFNTHCLEINNSSFVMAEENEFYDYHRHAILVYYSFGNILRRNYCNPRNRADIPGGYPTSGGNNSGDDCIAVYPGYENIVENNLADGTGLKGFTNEATSQSTDNSWFGNISNGLDRCITNDARGNTLGQMPRNNTIKDLACIVPSVSTLGTAREGVYFRSAKNSQCINCMILGTPLRGIVADKESGAVGDGIYSSIITNSLVVGTGVTTVGMLLTSDIATWTGTNVNVFGVGTPYNPASSVNWVSKFTTDPQLGTCKVYRPAGSNAKVNNWGTDILYRYENGALTTTPLWDPTTGMFPHGRIVSGLNDTAGNSINDVHTRLNVNSGGCPFPPGYGGTGGSGGGGSMAIVGTASAVGTTSAAQNRTITAGNAIIAFVHIRDGGLNVGSVSSVTGCGAENFTAAPNGRGTSAPSGALHAMEVWYKLNSAGGSCTITALTTGGATTTILTAIEVSGVGFVGLAAANGSTGSSTPSVTVGTNNGEYILAATSGSSSTTISPGPNQSQITDTLSAPTRLTTSDQSGNDGGVMSFVLGASSNWAISAISLQSVAPDPPSTATLRLSKYQIFSLRGLPNATAPLADVNTAAYLGGAGGARIRTEITASVATTSPFGVSLYCSLDGGSYARIQNTFGSNLIRFFGPNFSPDIPAGQPTTQLFTGSPFTTGQSIGNEDSSFVVPAMAPGTRTEVEFLTINSSALTEGQYHTCEVRKDDGTQLDPSAGNKGYTVRPVLQTISPRGEVGY